MIKKLYQVPVASTAFEGDAGIEGNVLRYRYYRGESLTLGGIQFCRVAATRSRAERCCTAWQIENAYDTLVEVTDSSWVKEIAEATQPMWRDKWAMNHYMIYLDSAGCFEVISESWKALPEEAV